MPKILLFSSFYIKMTTPKFTNFDKFFFLKHSYDSCHNTIVLNEVKGI